MVIPDYHPAIDQLTDFALGKLPEAESKEIELHLADCPDCLKVTADLAPDTLVNILAAVSTITDSRSGFSDLCSEAAFPPALVNHPRYTLIRLLGLGGMGSVWLAEHAVMGRRVAIKVIRPEFLSKPGAIQRFQREVAAAALLHHPHIVTAHDAEQAGGSHFLVMEFIQGVGLDELLKTKGPLPIRDSCRYIKEAALALGYASRQNIVHRDVKPSNLMLTEDGRIKILDFGLAMMVAEDEPDMALTAANMIVGTPDYIAPEQAEFPHQADGRADVYSLGCTFYHLLTGHPPFPGKSVLQKLDAHRRQQPQPPHKIRAEVSPELSEIVMTMLMKEPSMRYQTVEEVSTALDAFLSGKQPKRVSRRSMTIARFALVASLILLAGIVFRIQTDKGELVISTSSDDVEVVVKKGGELVTILDTKTQKRIELRSGEYDLELKAAEGLKLNITKATLSRGTEVLATVERLEKPDQAKADPMNRIPGIGGSSGFEFGSGMGPGASGGIGMGSGSSPGGMGMPNAGPGMLSGGAGMGESATSGGEGGGSWLGANQDPYKFMLNKHTKSVWSVAFSQDGKTLASAGGSDGPGEWKLWDLETKKVIVEGTGKKSIPAIAFSPDGKSVVTAEEDKTARMYDARTGKAGLFFEGHSDCLGTVAFSPDGKKIATGSLDKTVKFWSLDNNKMPPDFNHGSDVYALAFSSDGRKLATGGRDGILKVWDTTNGKELISLGGHSNSISRIAFSPHGKIAASASWDKTVRLWNLESGERLASMEGHSAEVMGVAFSPDGKTLASVSGHWGDSNEKPGPGEIIIWDVATQQKINVVTGHPDRILTVAFSPDGKTLATGSWDKTIILWDVRKLMNPGRPSGMFGGGGRGTKSSDPLVRPKP
jgi:serine/threonine protein kinase